jgi:hypothetical protein
MKRLAAQLLPIILAALFSLMALATAPNELQDSTETARLGTGQRFLTFAVRFLVVRLFWGS